MPDGVSDKDETLTTRLDVAGLVRRFGGRAVVDGVTLKVQGGQVTCLLGPSGCGKSTTLRMIAGIEEPDSGRIAIDGVPVAGDGLNVAPEHRGVGLMFQDFALFPHLSVLDNVAFGLDGPRPSRRARAEAMLDRMELGRFASAFPHTLSGGEQQRVALARALAPKPPVMLMDEPFSGLDNRLRDGIRDETLAILKEEGAAVVLVTHEPDEAMRMADEIALMRDGQVVQTGKPYEVYSRPVDRAAAVFFSDLNVIEGRVKNELAETPFGPIAAPGFAEASKVDVVVRPQHVHLDFERPRQGLRQTDAHGLPVKAHVLRARYLGRDSLIELMTEDCGMIRATVPGAFLPAPGTRFWLTLPRDRCFVFAAESGP
ncbi:MAG: ABC transporter ATP-binding protein [Pseudomonadota bacterium]